MELNPGDRLVLILRDGITEAEEADGAEFGGGEGHSHSPKGMPRIPRRG